MQRHSHTKDRARIELWAPEVDILIEALELSLDSDRAASTSVVHLQCLAGDFLALRARMRRLAGEGPRVRVVRLDDVEQE
jgi:hypothetical protein